MATKKTKTKKTKSKKTVTKTEVMAAEIVNSKVSSANRFKALSSKKPALLLGIVVLVVLAFLLFKWLVVAWVDGKPLTRITLFNELSSKYGEDTREQIISEKLIMAEAQKRNVSVSDGELNAEIKKTEDQVGGKEALQGLLEQQKVKEADFQKQVRIQLLIQKMFEKDASVSAGEVDKYIEENKDTLVEATDTAKLKEDVTSQLKQQKLSQIFSTWLQEALKSSRVTRN